MEDGDWRERLSGQRRAIIRSLNPMRKPRKSDYTQIEEISSGSFGAVHLVRHKDTNKVFAMKKQCRSDMDDPSYLKMAYLERDITIFSDCPFVVSTFCSFPTKQHLCMVMDFEAGGDCYSLLRFYGPLPLDLARMYIAETVLAVEYLHSYGVVHRDLKPGNLMISSTGHIKVTDFGLSKLGLMRPASDNYKVRTKDITREFRDNEVFGTFHYVAPEVILQKGYGRPIDWWSIGIILYEFLTGHVPFNGRCKKDIFNSIIRDDITLKIKISTDNPDAQDFMTQLLRKDPTHRLGTGGANEVKSHPFLRKLDFENLQYTKPWFRPDLSSEEDTRYFQNGIWRPRHRDSHEGYTSKVRKWPESLNYVSSSQRLSKLYATNARMMSNEDHEQSPDCSLETFTKHSDVQKESSPTRNDGDNQCFTTENNKSPSPILSVETTNTSAVKLEEEQNLEIVAETELSRVETKNTSVLNLGEDQDPEIVAETEPSRVEMTNTSAVKLGEEHNPEIVPETEPSRVETTNTSAVKLGEEHNPEIVPETEPSRVETTNTSAVKLGEEHNPEIVPETEPSRVETTNTSAVKLGEEHNPEIVPETEPSRGRLPVSTRARKRVSIARFFILILYFTLKYGFRYRFPILQTYRNSVSEFRYQIQKIADLMADPTQGSGFMKPDFAKSRQLLKMADPVREIGQQKLLPVSLSTLNTPMCGVNHSLGTRRGLRREVVTFGNAEFDGMVCGRHVAFAEAPGVPKQ
ncbi:unnamed protein product [Ranitomeya imitator]|uniref:non-specific serine/threonine protein kinase n=1 Tax=Ranitomeya imitator TaxID=111125 RepID=A0ABN9MH48_9NEOB|nr:unnamed protein product [Ranitomeya imitator]